MQVSLDSFKATCLLTSSQVAQIADVSTAVLGFTASSVVMGAALIPAIPVLAVTGAIATGIGVAGYSIGRGIHKLFDRSSHEQVRIFFWNNIFAT